MVLENQSAIEQERQAFHALSIAADAYFRVNALALVKNHGMVYNINSLKLLWTALVEAYVDYKIAQKRLDPRTNPDLRVYTQLTEAEFNELNADAVNIFALKFASVPMAAPVDQASPVNTGIEETMARTSKITDTQ